MAQSCGRPNFFLGPIGAGVKRANKVVIWYKILVPLISLIYKIIALERHFSIFDLKARVNCAMVSIKGLNLVF